METLSINEHHTIIIETDRIVCRRADVFSEEFKEKVYRFDQIRYVDYVPKQFDWIATIIACIGNAFYYKQGKIRIVFLGNERRITEYILTGELSNKEIQNIVSKINTAQKIWKLSSEMK
jgi:hypothetical protein